MASTPDDIQKDCPVCMENFMVPIYQCFNGHLLCKNCIPLLETCPICRDELPLEKMRNYEAEKIISGLPFACINTDIGCKDLNRHEPLDCAFACDNFCSYLGIPKCQELVKREDLETHLMINHDILGKFTAAGETVQVCQHGGTADQIEEAEVGWNPNFIVQGDRTFFLTTRITSASIISWIVYVVGSDDVAQQYSAKIKLFSPDAEMKGRYFKWSGQVFSLNSRVRKEEYHTFNLRAEQLRPLMGDSSEGKGYLLNVLIRNNEAKTGLSRPDPVRIDSRAVRVLGIHSTTQCDVCLIKPIVGMRYKCVECEDYDLCSSCAHSERNHYHHLFIMLQSPNQRRELYGAFTQLQSLHTSWSCDEVSNQFHTRTTCDGCGMSPLAGPRHKCVSCNNYDLCSVCAGRNFHEHGLFLVAITPNTSRKLQSAFEQLFARNFHSVGYQFVSVDSAHDVAY